MLQLQTHQSCRLRERVNKSRAAPWNQTKPMWSHHPAGSLLLFWVTLDPDICIPPLKETEGPKGYQSNESRITNSLIDAMVCCISTLCMALRSSAQGPRGLNYGMGSFAIAGHGMPNFLVRRRSEYRLMPRHVFFCFFGKKSEAHKCFRDAICLNTPKIAWQGSTPEIFNVFAPGIAGLHLGEDWECCQRLQRRNSAERLNRKIGAFGSQVSCTRISYAEIANKWSQKVQVIFDSQALHQPFLYQTKVLLIRSWISPVDEIERGWSLYIPWLRSTTRSARSVAAKVNCARPLEPKGWVTGLWRLKGSNQLQKMT